MPSRRKSQKSAMRLGSCTEMRTCFCDWRYRAARLGRYPSDWAVLSTSARVVSLTSGLPWSARSTVPVEMPRARAMSLMPTGFGPEAWCLESAGMRRHLRTKFDHGHSATARRAASISAQAPEHARPRAALPERQDEVPLFHPYDEGVCRGDGTRRVVTSTG